MNNPIIQLTLARWRSFLREPQALFWTFVFPLLLSVILGLAFRNQSSERVYVAIERGNHAEAIYTALSRSNEIAPSLLDPSEAQSQLRAGKIAIVVVPGSPRIFRYDPTRSESRSARVLVDDTLQRAEGRRDVTPTAEAQIHEPGSRYIDFLLPGLLGVSLMSGSMWGIGYVLVEMRMRKLLKRLKTTPMSHTHFLMSFLLMRGVVLLVELALFSSVAWIVFHIVIRGSILTFLLTSALGALSFAGIALLVASRSQNTQSVNGLINLVMMPMYIFSGVFFPPTHFPDFAKPIIKTLPLTALNDALRAIMNEGVGLQAVGTPLIILACWGIIGFYGAHKLFRWQ